MGRGRTVTAPPPFEGKVAMKIRTRVFALALGIALIGPIGVTAASAAPTPVSTSSQVSVARFASTTFANCTALNKKYKHGVGKTGARDKVRGSTKPVTTFAVNTKVYNKNAKSDRDKDGVACEKK